MNVTTQPAPDPVLLAQYVQGCNRSLEELLFRYKDKIFTAIYTLVKDRFLADDLLQETFLRIIRCLQNGKYDEQGKFLPWAMRMAHNLCMDHFRKTAKNQKITLSNGDDIINLIGNELPANYAPPIEVIQTSHHIRKLIMQLPPEQREVIVLRIYSELSFKEISSATGVSINTALGRMRYALQNLRKMMHENGINLR